MFDCDPVADDCLVAALLWRGVRLLSHVACGADWCCGCCGLCGDPRLFDCDPIAGGCLVSAPLLGCVWWLVHVLRGADWCCESCVLRVDPRLFDCDPVDDCVVVVPLLRGYRLLLHIVLIECCGDFFMAACVLSCLMVAPLLRSVRCLLFVVLLALCCGCVECSVYLLLRVWLRGHLEVGCLSCFLLR